MPSVRIIFICKSIENTEQVRELEKSYLGWTNARDRERYDAVSEIIEFTDFEGQDHQNIFQSMGELVNSNKPLDPLTVSDRLDSKNLLTRAGGKNYLIDLASYQSLRCKFRSLCWDD